MHSPAAAERPPSKRVTACSLIRSQPLTSRATGRALADHSGPERGGGHVRSRSFAGAPRLVPRQSGAPGPDGRSGPGSSRALEAAGIEPASRDAPAWASTCVGRQLGSHSTCLRRPGCRGASSTKSRRERAEQPSATSLLDIAAAPRRRRGGDVTALSGSQGVVLVGTSGFCRVLTRPPGTSARHPRRDSIRSMPIAP
jgi:hypothetical protein